MKKEPSQQTTRIIVHKGKKVTDTWRGLYPICSFFFKTIIIHLQKKEGIAPDADSGQADQRVVRSCRNRTRSSRSSQNLDIVVKYNFSILLRYML